MQLSRRKVIALLTLVAVLIMLWLERHEIARGTGESYFWVGVGVVAIILVAMELAGIGTSPDDGSDRRER